MKKIVFLLTFVMVFSFKNVNAVEKCTSSEMSRLNELANNIEIQKNIKFLEPDIKYQEIEAFYDLEILNNHPDLKIYYRSLNYDEEFSLATFLDPEEGGFLEGDTVKFNIYSYTDNLCTDRLLRTITIDLPIYNDYYYFNKDKCEKNSDFEYCEEYKDTSEIEFSEIEKLYKEHTSILDVDDILDNVNGSNIIWYICGIIVVLAVAIIFIIIILKKKKRKDDL